MCCRVLDYLCVGYCAGVLRCMLGMLGVARVVFGCWVLGVLCIVCGLCAVLGVGYLCVTYWAGCAVYRVLYIVCCVLGVYRVLGVLGVSSVGCWVLCCTMYNICLLYTSPSPRDQRGSRMPSSA